MQRHAEHKAERLERHAAHEAKHEHEHGDEDCAPRTQAAFVKGTRRTSKNKFT